MIRHGMTAGNEEGRYVGLTDESLSEEGSLALGEKEMPKVDRLYTGPMKRCRETAGILFPHMEAGIVPGISECDFGAFEYKNYAELNGDPDYQAWIDSGGMLAFPGGESRVEYQKRAAECFETWIQTLLSDPGERVALICHGGFIMAVLDRFSQPHKDYFEWQVRNGEGFKMTLDLESAKCYDPEKI